MEAADAPAEVEARVGEPVEIALPYVPTSGFAWEPDAEGGPIAVAVADESAASRPLGSAAEQRFRLVAREPGTHDVVFRLRRGAGAPVDERRLRVTATA